MIEVKVCLFCGFVFFVGECIECEIIFINVVDGKKEICSYLCNYVNNDFLDGSNEMDRFVWVSV